MDIEGAEENLKIFKEKVKDVKVFPICAITGTGLKDVLIELSNMLDKIEKKPLYEEEKFESHILYKFKKEQPFTIENENGVWVIKGDQVEKLYRMTRFTTDEAALRFSNKLRRMGIDDKLKELGANDGDTVRIEFNSGNERFDAEIIGKNSLYPSAYFKKTPKTSALVRLLNSRMNYVMWEREHPNWQEHEEFLKQREAAKYVRE
jgi:Obg family GTPase CgtA-like protein